MNKNNVLKILEFQRDFKKLLSDYNLSISGSCMDDGSMDLSYYDDQSDWNYQFYMDDRYNIKTNPLDDKMVDIRDIFITNLFPLSNNNDFYKDSTAIIFTYNRNKVIDYMESFDSVIEKRVSVDDISFKLKDGRSFKWVKPNTTARGHRCRYALIDRELDLFNNGETLCLICHICIFATQETIKII